MKISELNTDQKSHLAYLLDNKTYVGMITAGRIARGEMGDVEIEEVFRKADKTLRWARYYANKVETFVLPEGQREALDATLPLMLKVGMLLQDATAGMSIKNTLIVYRGAANYLKNMIESLEILDGGQNELVG